MTKLTSNIECPSCSGPLAPKVLTCDKCDIRVEGPFELNEFATLSGEDLHFLRIFIRCEGRIRDMEPALGLSYPTIRSRLTQLKNKLIGETDEKTSSGAAPQKDTPQSILKQLEEGKITFDEAMSRIKSLK